MSGHLSGERGYSLRSRIGRNSHRVRPLLHQQILATFAEFDFDLLRMRTREGVAIAKAKGKLKGRGPKPSPARQAHLLKLHAAEEHTIADLAELFEVSRPTVYRVLERHRESATVHQESSSPAVSGSRSGRRPPRSSGKWKE
ncbi:MAG: helix-turn-helix domain-containing protein [Propionibacteriales bacterium]|nr:helix-turn-helix domain-containing protein [Propionibacteriales bacterium]